MKKITNKSKNLKKKMFILNSLKTKNQIKEKNSSILNEFNNINLKDNYLSQRNILENLTEKEENKKIILKWIISILLNTKTNI